MRVAALVCNAVLFAFTCSVLATDGTPTKAYDVLMTLVVLLVPVVGFLVILHSGMTEGWLGGRTRPGSPAEPPYGIGVARQVALYGNALLLALACWAVATRYPSHPAEQGLLAYVALTVATPVLTILVLLRIMRRHGVEQPGAAGP